MGRVLQVKDFGRLSYFLELEADHGSMGLVLSQRKYIKILLTRSNMLQSKPVTSPMAASLKLSKYDTLTFEDATLYRSLVGGYSIYLLLALTYL